MLLRHTATALAIATTIGLGTGNAPTTAPTNASLPPASGHVAAPAMTPPPTDEIGGGSGLTCLGCVAGGVMTLASGSLFTVYATLMAGGAAAVGYGGIAVTCTTACVSYFTK